MLAHFLHGGDLTIDARQRGFAATIARVTSLLVARASLKLPAISRVVADCSSTSLAIALKLPSRSRMFLLTWSMSPTVLRVVCRMASTRSRMVPLACAAALASS